MASESKEMDVSDVDDDMTAEVAPPPTSSSSSSSSSAPAAAPDQSSFLPWVEKYRPNSLEDLISQGDIVNTINRLIDANRLPHMLFYGPPGTGKTSTILAIAKRLYGPQWKSMTLELNASDDRGIDVVRDQIKSFAGTRKLFSTGVKLVVLDEADAMTNDAQFALRRVIEKYAKNTRFCMICNYVSKIIPALQSRCTRFRFAPLLRPAITGRLRYIIDKEALTTRVTEEGVKAILQLGGGDMRRILNILQAAASGYETLDEDAIYAITGNPRPAEIKELMSKLTSDTFENGCAHVQAMSTTGYAVSDVLTEVARYSMATKIPSGLKAMLIDKLSDIEYRLAFGTSDKLQSAALVGAFHIMRDTLGKMKDSEGSRV